MRIEDDQLVLGANNERMKLTCLDDSKMFFKQESETEYLAFKKILPCRASVHISDTLAFIPNEKYEP